MPEVQTTVLGVVSRGEEFLVQRLTDPGAGPFYRPIGGGIEFGETSDEALEREFREELGVALEAGPVVGTVENQFTWDGDADHEIAILRRGEFVDDALYEAEVFSGVDAGGDVEYDACWHTLSALSAAPEPLYPAGIADLLDGSGSDGLGHLISSPE